MTHHNHSDHQAQAVAKKNKTLSHVWWLPFIAFLMVAYFTVNYFFSKGPLVTIQFAAAEGLTVNKTKVKYKDVIVGQVEDITLNTDLKGVTVAVRMNKGTNDLLKTHTRFWIEKPRISVTKVSGLSTLLSGNYISIEPDNHEGDTFQKQFIGLDEPPITLQDEPGVTVTLIADNASSVYAGTPVYFKGFQVGAVNRVYFADDYKSIKADTFIKSPYDKLIRQHTNFWSTNGFSVDLTNSGVDVTLESLEALVFGGISFETPRQIGKTLEITDGQEYVLHGSKKSIQSKTVKKLRYFVSYFSGSIKGLSLGSNVMIRGLKVGEVRDIVLFYDKNKNEPIASVLMSIDESQLKIIKDNRIISAKSNNDEKGIFEHLIEKGLQAQIDTDSLLTGAKYIELTLPVKEEAIAHYPIKRDGLTGYWLLPASDDKFDNLLSSVDKILSKVSDLPLQELLTNVNNVILTAGNKIDTLELGSVIKELNTLIKDAQKLPGSVKNTLSSAEDTFSEAEKTLSSVGHVATRLEGQLKTVLQGLSPDAPLYYNLNLTLESLEDTLSSVKSVSDLLDSKPEALIFGKEEELLYE